GRGAPRDHAHDDDRRDLARHARRARRRRTLMSAALWSRSNRGSFRIAMLALAALGLLVAAMPVGVIVVMSFSGDTSLQFPPRSLSMRWYGAALDVLRGEGSDSTVSAFEAMATSFAVGAITMVTAVLACVPLAYALVRSVGRWRRWIDLLFTLPLVFPLVVMGVAYLLLAETLAQDTGI